MNHASNSREQQIAEIYILQALNNNKDNNKDGYNLESTKLKLSSGSTVQLDGFDKDKQVICEIYARVGKLKGGQPDKVASDFLKMLLVEKELNKSFTKIFCFASEEASSYIEGKSWLGLVAKKFDIIIKTIELPAKIKEKIKRAQNRQKMVNAQSN